MTRAIKLIRNLVLIGLLVFITPFIWRWYVKWQYTPDIYTVETVPEKSVAIIYGAAVYQNERLSAVLKDRMDVGIELYQAGKVEKLLVSGDNSLENYDEPTVMMNYAIAQGVPAADVQPDFAGRRTYDTCYRAKYIFQVEDAILVTQQFHLPRALFTCNGVGIDVVAVNADPRPYRAATWYEIRETGATLKALWDVLWKQPAPVMGDPIPLE